MPKRTTGDRPELSRSTLGPPPSTSDQGCTWLRLTPLRPTAVRSFGTFTQDLHDLADWFKACGVTSVAMESTGVYWIPVYEILEQRGFDVILVNARYAKNVPGRKTDVSDAAWLRQLHSYGLLRGSFRPDADIATLRAYLRQRERLGGICRRPYSTYAKGPDGDEPATPSCGLGHHWRDRHADYPSHYCRRAQS
jgi:transposase